MSRKQVFSELLENLKLVGEKLKDDRSARAGKEVTLQEFWLQYVRLANAVSSECTKLTLAFSSHPTPSGAGCASFRERIESVVLTLVSTVYSLPISQGFRLRNRVFDTTVDIVFAVHSLVNVVCEHAESEHKTALQCTGGVWELCESVIPNLPRNNKQLTVALIKQTLGLVKDAIEEIEEELNKEDDNSDLGDIEDITWSEEDKKIVTPSIGIIKVARSTLKKLLEPIQNNGSCDSPDNVSDFDNICSKVDHISPAVDDVIEAVYPPLSKDTVMEQVEVLLKIVQSILNECPSWHMLTENDQTWVDFLQKAAEHNWTKLNTQED